MDGRNIKSGNIKKEVEPFFSIIIPVYNAANYIRECIESILAQDFEDWEVILVDDCSTDNSVDIIQEFCRLDTRIKIFTSESNSGSAFYPRLRAAELACGSYIVTIDADDIVSSDLLKKHYSYIKSMNADLVIPEMWRRFGSESYKILPSDSVDIDRLWQGKDLVEKTLGVWKIPMAGFALRRDIYLESNRMITANDRKSIFSDEVLSRWIFIMSRSVCFCEARYFYRYNNQSITHVNLPRVIDSKLISSESLISIVSANFGVNSPTYLRAIENKLFTLVEILRMLNKSKLSRHKKREFFKKISREIKMLDISRIKGRISSRYIALMRLPASLASKALKVMDPIIRLKNGI